MRSSVALEQSPDFVKVLDRLVQERGDELRGRARFRQGAEASREQVLVTPDFEVWMLSWLPGQVTPIHDHGGALTVTTVLAGVVLEERFVRTAGPLVRPTWTMVRVTGDIDSIDPSAIHRVRPLGTALTLHLSAPSCREGKTYEAVV